MILVVFHDLEFNVVCLMRQQFELLEIRAACSELVFCIVTVFSCNITTHVRLLVTLLKVVVAVQL